VKIEVVTAMMQQITGREDLRPEQATVLGPCKVIPQEYPHLSCRSIDIELAEEAGGEEDELIEAIVEELLNSRRDPVAAYRGKHWWIQEFEKVRVGEVESKTVLREGGVYLITGGMGRIGLELARYLVKNLRAHVVLVGRTAYPERKQWDEWIVSRGEHDPISKKIAILREIEREATEVAIEQADVSDERQMREVIKRVRRCYGGLDGVIHAAVGEDAVRLLNDIDEDYSARQFSAKVIGTYKLARVIEQENVNVCVLMSSLSAVLGGLGFTAYAGANAFLDAYAQAKRGKGKTRWVSVNWDGWRFESDRQVRRNGAIEDLEMDASEGVESLVRLLNLRREARIVVSTGDVNLRIRQWVKRDIGEGTGRDRGELNRHSRPKGIGEYEAPQSELEIEMVKIWEELLGVEPVGVSDNFFDLGGHSLLGTQVVSRVREEYGATFGLRDLFEQPTVRGLADTLESGLRGKAKTESTRLGRIRRVNREEGLPLSFAQQRLWFLDQLDSGNTAYNIPLAVRLRGELDLAVLERTLNEVVRRHESLRTTFSYVAGQGVQIIRELEVVSLPMADLSEAPETEREIEVRRLITEEAQRFFDLEKGPLMRVKLFRLRVDEYVMLVTMHHIITDRRSIEVLLREIGTIYQAFAAGQPSPLPELPIQYADYACWESRTLQGQVLETLLAFWKQQLHGSPQMLSLRAERRLSTALDSRSASHTIVLSERLSDGLKALSRRQSVTLFMLLLAAFKVLLSYLSGQNDLIVGTNSANRTRIETEDLIGFFINLIPLRANLSGDPSFLEFLAQTREVTLAAYAHQDLPFGKLVEELQPERKLNHSPLVQVVFQLFQDLELEMEFSGLKLQPFEFEFQATQFDLVLNMLETGRALVGSLEYNTDWFETAAITRLLRHFEIVLQSIVEKPDARLSELKAGLAEADRQQQIISEREYDEASRQKLMKIKRRAINPKSS
jgi:NAD(P)-dependent dehydrogenase (short-subunit alcohol dehydrogenase family)/acyl carrier protein